MDIVPVYYRNEQESLIERCEIDAFDDISRAVIDDFQKSKILDVADDGTVSCRTCEDSDEDCGHEQKIRERLRSIVNVGASVNEEEKADEGTGARPTPADD